MRTFRDFMESALYHPELGFYARREPRADFYTAPELTSAFAAATARRIEQLIRSLKLDSAKLVEMGCGDGLLAEQLLSVLPAGTPYILIERSAPARAKAVERLSRFPNVQAYASLDELAPFEGVLLSNELVDAFPVHVLERRGESVHEVYVDEEGRETLGALSLPQLHAHAAAVEWQEGDRHAVNLEAARWLSDVASRLSRGAVLTFDYGKKFSSAPNPPRGFFRHSVTDSGLTARQGRQDLTASVDFAALAREGEAVGLREHSYETLASFLLKGGIADFLPAGNSVAEIRARGQIKTLLHPEAMGEAFKVMIQIKSEARPS